MGSVENYSAEATHTIHGMKLIIASFAVACTQARYLLTPGMFEKVGQIYVPIEEAVVPQNVVYQQELPNLPTRIIRPAEVQSTVQQAPRYIPQQQVVYLPRESESTVPAIEAPAKVVVPEY